ncbi:unnamed protein product [Rotaria sp. Silwood2]|nr:unnamed protein product [Rotaria sp. Silwood2]CAF2923375.1 unnamed protein product [Rotaria sp. Silwood2]CAF3295067.1 unnamed protein product [Rotaria sp. Silwood2]CAF4230467.1 unnamed protein product [Rotaria sp. Silwood2]CAF4346329.1 unnamed protein product [Rotaria sp. Silwood2]
MTTNQISRAQAAGRLQESIEILHEHLLTYLLLVINQSKKSSQDQRVLRDEVNNADFSNLAKFVARDHWNDLLLHRKGGCPIQMRSLARRAIDIRNSVSHQNFDIDKYEHALETLAKLATAIDKPDVARDIRAKTSVSLTLDAWEELKENGNACFKQKQWTEAMNYYTQALRLNQKQPILYANRALCEINLTKYELAREDAEDAIELDSTQVKYYRILSEVLMTLELFSEADGACTDGLKIEPRDSVLLSRQRDCRAHLMTLYTDIHNPRSIQPEPKSRDDFLSQMQTLIITPTPCNEDVLDIKDFPTCLKVNNLMIEIKRLFRTGKAENERRILQLYEETARLAGVDIDQIKATEYFRRSAEHGCPEGQNNFAVALLNGLGIKKNEEWARSWFARAAQCGIAEAQFNYADLLADGIGGSTDISQALDFYRHAADQGYPDAYKKIQEVQSRRGTSLKPVVREDTAENNPHVLMLLASNYARGEGGYHKNMNLAEEYYRRAANCGNLEAEFALAEILLYHFKRNGDGFAFMKQAAEKGHALAQWRLGRLFAFGHGCEQNLDEARRWLTRGRRQGVKYCSTSERNTMGDENNVDQELTVAKAVYNFEQKHPELSNDEITIDERILRVLSQLLPLNMSQISNITSLSTPLDETTVLIPREYSLLNKEVFEEVERRAYAGSITAKQYQMAIMMLIEALDEEENSPVKALSLLRNAYLLCERLPIPMSFSDIAQTRLEVNPYDADALHLIVRIEHRSFKERVRLLEECIKHNPLAADIHHLLADMYMFTKEYDKAERACARALELDFHPGWLYTQAGATKFLYDTQNSTRVTSRKGFRSRTTMDQTRNEIKSKTSIEITNKIIAIYNRFIELNPVDHRKVPMAHFTLAFIYMSRNEPQLTYHHWLKLQETDNPSVRLSCHEPVDINCEMKTMMEIWFEKQGLLLTTPFTGLQLSSTSSSESKEHIQVCDQCKKPNPPKSCPCRKAHYCDAKC